MEKLQIILTHLAQYLGTPEELGIPDKSADGASLNSILNVVYMLAGIIAVIVIIVAGILYTTSGGDSGKVTRAKDAILYSVIGLIVIASAFAITNFVIGRF